MGKANSHFGRDVIVLNGRYQLRGDRDPDTGLVRHDLVKVRSVEFDVNDGILRVGVSFRAQPCDLPEDLDDQGYCKEVGCWCFPSSLRLSE